MSGLNCIKNLFSLKKFDTYAEPISFYHTGRQHTQTNFGGFMRLVALGLVAYYIYEFALPHIQAMILDQFGPDANPNKDNISIMYQKSRVLTAKPSKYKGVLTNQDFNLTVVLEKGKLVESLYTADPTLREIGEIEQFGGKDFMKYIDLRLFMIDTN